MKYQITGAPFAVVTCTLENGESMNCESGSMSWMSSNIQMSTGSNGGFGKLVSRALSREKLFQNTYTSKDGNGTIAFASSFPGDIIPVTITPDSEIICQKAAYLASTPGVELSIHFQKKLGAGFFGGEGFIMEKLSGNGIAFLEIDGSATEITLAPGQQMIIDTGYLVMMDKTCHMDIQTVKGVKNILFGGEGLFNTVVTGPGKIVLQSMPISKTAMTLYQYMPHPSSN